MSPFEEISTALLERVPAFRKKLVESADMWLSEDGRCSPCAIATQVADFVVDALNDEQKNAETLVAIFQVIEERMNSTSSVVRDALATCCLESLMNRCGTTGNFSWVSYLGAVSAEQCRAWDKFTGVKTPGLWKDV